MTAVSFVSNRSGAHLTKQLSAQLRGRMDAAPSLSARHLRRCQSAFPCNSTHAHCDPDVGSEHKAILVVARGLPVCISYLFYVDLLLCDSDSVAAVRNATCTTYRAVAHE